MALELNGTTGVSLVQDGVVTRDDLDATVGYGLKSMQVFDTAGSHTWTKPSGVKYVKVYVTAGGGGGGQGSNNYNSGGGGGAGGTSIKWIDVSSVSSVSVTVGSGANGGGVSGTPDEGGTGGSSSFGAYCSATGGGPGLNDNDTSFPGNSGTATGGDINLPGGDGGPKGGGNNNDEPSNASMGGASFWGGGGQGAVAGGTRKLTGEDGPAPGSGGGGGDNDTSTSGTGGNGADGIVVVEEYS